MPFPKHLLTDDEDLVLDLRPHWWYLAPVGLVLAIVSALGLGALVQSWWSPVEWVVLALWLGAVGYFAVQYMQWTTTNFVVTSERVISRTGVISKEGIEIPLDRINTVFFNQSIFERMIGAGDLGIESILCEGGSTLAGSLLRESLVQRLYLFVAPMTLGPEAVPAFSDTVHPLDWEHFSPAFAPEVHGHDTLIVLDREES